MRRTGNRPQGLERRRVTVKRCGCCGCPHECMVFVRAELPRVDHEQVEYPWKAYCVVSKSWLWATDDSVPEAAAPE